MAEPDADAAVRIVVTPSQSSYFAGEPFSVTITFTNTRSPHTDPARPRAGSHTNSQSPHRAHRRNAHSISSAPIARPPTSPGTPRTPKTAVPLTALGREEGWRLGRKGLIGRTVAAAASPTAGASSSASSPVLEASPSSSSLPQDGSGSLPALVELRRKKMLAKSLSVSIAPPDRDLDLSLVGGRGTPRSASFLPESPTSATLPSSISRRSDTLPLAASHPHARKHSVLDGIPLQELITSPISPSPSGTGAYTPSASSSTFSLALDPISEAAATAYPYPPTPAIPPTPAGGVFGGAPTITVGHSQPLIMSGATVSAPAAGARRNPQIGIGMGHPSSSGAGAGQSPISPSTPTKSFLRSHSHNQHTLNAAAHPPNTQLLLYAYAALSGRAVLAPLPNAALPALASLKNNLRRSGVGARGGGSISLGVGGVGSSPLSAMGGGVERVGLSARPAQHRRASSFSAGLRAISLGIWGRSSVDGGASTSSAASDEGASVGDSGGSGIPNSGGAGDGGDPEAPVPTLEVPPEMLAVDLALAPGESRSYTYTLLLPAHLPPTFKGRTLRFSYELVVGACRAAPAASGSGGSGIGGGGSRSSVMKVPIRVYGYVGVGRPARPYDLMWPVARRIGAPPSTPSSAHPPTNAKHAPEPRPPKPTVIEHRPAAAAAALTLTASTSAPAKLQQTPQQQQSGSVEELARYAARLLASGAASSGLGEDGDGDGLGEEGLSGAAAGVQRQGGGGGGLSGCREAVEVLTRNLKKVSYDITKDGVTVAVLTFPKSGFRLGETVSGVVEVNWRQGRGRVLQLTALLEAHESLPSALAVPPSTPATARYLRRVHAEHHSRFVLGTLRLGFALDIPSDGSPAFGIVAGDSAGGSAGGLEWKVRLCLLVGVTREEGDAGTEGVRVKGLVRDGDEDGGGGRGAWGSAWRAPGRLGVMERVPLPPPSPSSPREPEKAAGWGAFLAASFLGGREGGDYHDGDDFDDVEGEGDGADEEEAYGYDGVKSDLAGGVGVGVRYGGREEGWSEVKVEMVECVVPVRVWAGNTAFRAGDVVFDV
ncbi:Rgp1-domain-containing protein [Mycena metata]|uniref:Rgp1-domain-containing protein n=1 Tax=Mycena metata TaxID=1033252 RepID=A0AAD7NPV1_9AGAR|nr:Rgp1-domain-containing protein [Mycena metata]